MTFTHTLARAFCYVATAAAVTGEAQERSCHVDGVETPVTCVTIDVPRDYDAPDGGTIALTAVVIPATTARPAPDPMLVLSGGPGQAATDTAGMPLFDLVRRERDVVLLDVRGTGLSEPLECVPPETPAGGAEGALLALATLEKQRELAARCALELGDRVRHHTDRELVEDIERFRVARGYERLNLLGSSFGTRVALHYIRAYGENVRAVVLDSVTPAGTSIFVTSARAPDVALAKLFAACAADAGCSAAFPGLPAKLERLLASVSASPVTTTAVSPITGRSEPVTFDRFLLSNAVRVALYFRASTEILPFAIDAAEAGNWAPFLGIYAVMGEEVQTSLGMQYSVFCAEDWPIARDAGAAARTGDLMHDGFYEVYAQACEVWPQASLPAAMLEPFASDVPALAISGELDPITPPELAEQTLRQFSTAVHVVVPNGFHGNSADPCVARIIESFLSEPASGGRDHGCVSTPPLRFFTGPSS